MAGAQGGQEVRGGHGAVARATVMLGFLLLAGVQAEAFAVCDQVGVLKDGHLQQWDTP